MRNEFLKASAARLFSVAASLANGLISLKLYSLFFSPDVYGIMVVALQIVSYLPMLDGGFRMATNRRLLASGPADRPTLIAFSQKIYSWLLIFGLLAGTLLMGGYALLPHPRAAGEWTPLLFLALGGTSALAMFASAQAGLLLGVNAQAAMAVVMGLSVLSGVGALAASLFLRAGLWAFPLSTLCSGCFMYVAALLALRGHGIRPPLFCLTLNQEFWRIFREIRGQAWAAFRSQVAIVFVFSMDIIIASFFCKPADVAIYGIVSRILGIARSFLQVFNEATWPLVAARVHGIERFQDKFVGINALLYGLAGGGMSVLLPGFVVWYMGSAWQPPLLLVGLFVTRFIIIGIAGSASYYLIGKGDFRAVAKCTEYELLVSTALALALAPTLGIEGVAFAFLFGTAGGTLLPFWIFYSRQRGTALAPLLATLWLRVFAGFSIGWLVATFVLKVLPVLPLHR